MADPLAVVASTQFGLITWDQALAAGLSKSAIGRRLEAEEWTRIHPAVYALPGSVDSWERSLRAAQLWIPDAIVSHRAAAAVWELDGVTDRLTELTRATNGRRQRNGVIIHSTDCLPNKHVTTRKGLRVTTPTRTLLDLGGVVPGNVVEAALDDALRKRYTAVPLLVEILKEAGASGRPGTAVLRALMERRPLGELPTESRFETRLFRLLDSSKLPRPVKQYVVRDEGGGFVARADFAIIDCKIAIEAESYQYHMGRKPFLSDIQKHNLLTARRWRILKVTWDDLVQRPQWVVDQLRAMLTA